jgi:glycosyltransferase involved in cell wall biosynthesis
MNQDKTAPKVTLVVGPRERFSFTMTSLENIYEMTDIPFKLVYVDGGSPAPIRDYLKKQSQEKGFELIRTEHYLIPNVARNMGLQWVTTPYVVFVDNDVIVSPRWLTQLLDCAESTGATIVGPLTCQHEPVHEEVHFAGGEAHLFTDIKGRVRLREKMYKQGHKVEKLLPTLTRTETELCEFHCMLVRREIFEKLGYLDEKMLNTKEHLIESAISCIQSIVDEKLAQINDIQSIIKVSADERLRFKQLIDHAVYGDKQFCYCQPEIFKNSSASRSSVLARFCRSSQS